MLWASSPSSMLFPQSSLPSPQQGRVHCLMFNTNISSFRFFHDFSRWVKNFLYHVPEWYKWLYFSSDLTAFTLPPPIHNVGKWDAFAFFNENVIVSAFSSMLSHCLLPSYFSNLISPTSLNSLHMAPLFLLFYEHTHTHKILPSLSWWLSLPGMPFLRLISGQTSTHPLGLISVVTWLEMPSRIAASTVAFSDYSLS